MCIISQPLIIVVSVAACLFNDISANGTYLVVVCGSVSVGGVSLGVALCAALGALVPVLSLVRGPYL